MVENKGSCYSIQLLLTARLWEHCCDSGKLTQAYPYWLWPENWIHTISYHAAVRIRPIGQRSISSLKHNPKV